MIYLAFALRYIRVCFFLIVFVFQAPESIPNLEELVSQLAAMGLNDRAACVKTICFHHKFGEGLNEILEDLLSQPSSASSSSTAPVAVTSFPPPSPTPSVISSNDMMFALQ